MERLLSLNPGALIAVAGAETPCRTRPNKDYVRRSAVPLYVTSLIDTTNSEWIMRYFDSCDLWPFQVVALVAVDEKI